MTPNRLVKTLGTVDGGWTWSKYHASPYSGCSYSCAYCYNIDTGTTPSMIDDYLGKFEDDLKNLPRDVITIGDYQPLEKDTRAIRAMLELCGKYGFPVHLVERDPSVARDADMLQAVARGAGWSAVSMTILSVPGTGRPERAAAILEPDSPSSTERLGAMRELSEAGVLTGTAFMPAVPFLFDSEENIEAVAKATQENGGKYLLFGDFTIPTPLDYLFFESLQAEFLEEANKISELFGPGEASDYGQRLRVSYGQTKAACARHGLLDHIPRPLSHFPESVRDRKEKAGRLFLESRELYLGGAEQEEWQRVLTEAQKLESEE